MPETIDLTTIDTDVDGRVGSLYSIANLNSAIQNARLHGVYLSLSDVHRTFLSARKIAIAFLNTCTPSSRLAGQASLAATILEAQRPGKLQIVSENENSTRARDEFELTLPGKSVEVARLKHAGYRIDPFCSTCNRRYDRDSNRDKSCRSHPGKMNH